MKYFQNGKTLSKSEICVDKVEIRTKFFANDD